MMNGHHFWWRFFPHKELTKIYLSAAVRSFAVSLVSIFVPLYLYTDLGFSLYQTLLFFIVYSLVLGLSSPFAAKFAVKYGCKHSILVSVPLYLLFILFLYWLPAVSIPLPIIGAILGLSLAFYWMGMHTIFCKVSDHKHRGEEFGKREGISILATMAGPLIGGFLIKFVGFKLVFLITALLLFASAFFMFLSKEEKVRCNFSFRYLLNKKHWKNSVFFISRGTRVIAAGVIWPLFVFVILKDYLSLGIIESILAGISAILVWLIGKYSDHINRHKIIKIVTGFESLSWFLRAMVTTVTQVFGVTIFSSVSYGAYEAPVGALEYDKAKGDVMAYFVNRELFLCLGRVLLLLVVLVTNSLSGGLIFNGVATLAGFLF